MVYPYILNILEMMDNFNFITLKNTLITLFYTNLVIKLIFITFLSLLIYFFCINKETYIDVTKHLYKYKINNVLLNNGFVVIYISFYSYLVFVIRTKYLTKEILI